MESSRTLPPPGGGAPSHRGNWLLNQDSRQLCADDKTPRAGWPYLGPRFKTALRRRLAEITLLVEIPAKKFLCALGTFLALSGYRLSARRQQTSCARFPLASAEFLKIGAPEQRVSGAPVMSLRLLTTPCDGPSSAHDGRPAYPSITHDSR